MSTAESDEEEEEETETVFVAPIIESSVDLPMEEWSSLIITAPKENRKRELFEKGIYKPDSGEICSKYISMSASSILLHPYYNYPAVLDPGIKEALLNPEEQIIYPNDGQKLYLKICDEMNQCPVMSFYRGLVTDTINLKYYCVNPFGIRAMAIALNSNRHVVTLDLTDNHFNDDACFHLGEMLKSNYTLKELILSGCKIGASGAKRIFAGLPLNRGLRILNINKNEIGDAGVEHLCDVAYFGLDLEQLSLSYNNVTGKSAGGLAEALQACNKFTHLDFSWNKLFAPVSGTVALLNYLSENRVLQDLNLSWNSLSGGRIGTALKSILKCPNLRYMNLCNNKLSGEAIENFIGYLNKAKKLITLDLSNNPMTLDDALIVIQKMKFNTVKVQNVFMDNVSINKQFLKVLKHVKTMKIRINFNITYGRVVDGLEAAGPDMRDLVLNRVEFLTKVQKRKVDFVLFAMQLLKNNVIIMSGKNFEDAVNQAEIPLDSDLIGEIVNVFPGPKSTKAKLINIGILVEYMQRKWPDRKLPPTPPPTKIELESGEAKT